MLPQAEKMAEADHERYQQTTEPHSLRSIVSFSGFAVAAQISRFLPSVRLGSLLVSLVVCFRQKHRQKSLPDIAQDAEQSNPRSGH